MKSVHQYNDVGKSQIANIKFVAELGLRSEEGVYIRYMTDKRRNEEFRYEV